MRFEAYDDLAGRPNLILDGSPTAGTALTVTHWPGYPPPEEIAADLSAQMAFRLLEQPDLVPDGVELVSNNHFDQDGLVSIFAVTKPDEALPRRARLEDVASAGDFATYRDRDAARLSMAISAMAAGDDPSLPDLPEDYPARTAVLYAEALGRLAAWCDRPEDVRHLWGDEDDSLSRSDAAFEAGEVGIVERPDVDLAVVTVAPSAPDAGGHRFGGDWVGGLHPMAVFARTDRRVVATVRGRRYIVEERYETWVQLRSRPIRLRRDLAPLAARLQDEEAGDARWSATAVSGLTPRLTSGDGDSSLPPERVVGLLADHLATAPPAWDPFRAGNPAVLQ